MVSRSARHGNRYGDYGIWRRCHDRRASGEQTDDLLRDPHLCRRDGNFPSDGSTLFHLYDGWRLVLSSTTHGLEARRLDATCCGKQLDDYAKTCACQPRLGDSAILVGMGSALSECVGRNWHYRHVFTAFAGSLCWPIDRRAGSV